MKPIDFLKNTNPFGPSKKAVSELIKSAQKLNDYPDPKNINLNKDIANFFNVPFENVTIVNGSMEAIYSIPQILKPKTAGLIVPTFWGYEDAIKFNHIKLTKSKMGKDLEYSYDKINELASKSSLLFLCNPNNPTLSYIEKEKISKIIKNNPNCHFVIDETVLIFDYDFNKKTLIDMVCKVKNLSVICSFSKIFSISGLRVGAVISNKKLIDKIKEWKIIFSTNTMTQSIIPVCLNDKSFIKKSRKDIKELVDNFSKDLASVEWLSCRKGLGNFITCEIKNNKTSADLLKEYLKKKGFLIRSLNSYSELKGEWIRISINTKENNKKLIKAIKDYDK